MVINPDFSGRTSTGPKSAARYLLDAGSSTPSGNRTAMSALVGEQRLGGRTMRAIIFILIIAVLVIIAGIATGFLDINQIRGAKTPQIAATANGVTAKGGQTPAFDVETGSVKVGTQQKTVTVPTLQVQKPAQNEATATTNNAM